MTGRARKVRLTEAGVARLKPGSTEYTVRDSHVLGLGVRVRPSGHRSFVWHGIVNGRAVRTTVGSAALMTVEEARSECRALQNGQHSRGAGIASAGLAAVPLFREFVMGEWLPARQGHCSPAWSKRVEHMARQQLVPAFGALRIDRIGRPEVERWFDTLSRKTPGAANMTLTMLHQIMSAAKAAGYVGTDPVAGVRPNPRKKMTRFLSAEEIGRLHWTLERPRGGAAFPPTSG